MDKSKKRLNSKDLHPLVRRAAGGELPKWAVAGKSRRAHIDRVATLMDEWANALGLSKAERMRWRAAAVLHDALRDEPGAKLRPAVPARFRILPDRVLHGPAAAHKLVQAGVGDARVLRAVRYHTLGHRKLDVMGRSLCVADYVEPGRLRNRKWRDELKERMPGDVDDVVREIFRSRIRLVAQRGDLLTRWTVGFWNALVDEDQR